MVLEEAVDYLLHHLYGARALVVLELEVLVGQVGRAARVQFGAVGGRGYVTRPVRGHVQPSVQFTAVVTTAPLTMTTSRVGHQGHPHVGVVVVGHEPGVGRRVVGVGAARRRPVRPAALRPEGRGRRAALGELGVALVGRTAVPLHGVVHGGW